MVCLVLLAACGSSRGNAPVDAPGGGDAAGDGASGSACGGFAHIACSATEYCDYADNGCGIGDQTGTCKPRPDTCPLSAASGASSGIVSTPACGCDGKTYASDCFAYMAGVDLDAHGICPIDSTKFACGYTQCDLATQYCRREPHPGAAETFTCVALPAACSGGASCPCLAGERCGTACTGDARLGLTVTCA